MNTKVTPAILGTSVLIISILLFYFLFSSNNDLDNDGVVDDNDQCPKVFGTIENKGCPDKNNSNSMDLKSFEAEDLNFEKRIDLLMNGTMICTEHKLLITGEHLNIIVGRKLKYSKDKWYWDNSDGNSPANTRIKFDQHLFTIYAKEVRAIDEREAVLNEKSIAGDNEDSGIRGISSLDGYGKLIFIDDCYILVAGAFKYESDCKTWVKKQHSAGVNNACPPVFVFPSNW